MLWWWWWLGRDVDDRVRMCQTRRTGEVMVVWVAWVGGWGGREGEGGERRHVGLFVLVDPGAKQQSLLSKSTDSDYLDCSF